MSTRSELTWHLGCRRGVGDRCQTLELDHSNDPPLRAVRVRDEASSISS